MCACLDQGARGEHCTRLLRRHRLAMDRTKPAKSHQFSNSARIQRLGDSRPASEPGGSATAIGLKPKARSSPSAAINAKTPMLTHHRSRKDDAMLDHLAEEVARDFCGHLIVGEDLTEPEV
jgi:hypothetical protein